MDDAPGGDRHGLAQHEGTRVHLPGHAAVVQQAGDPVANAADEVGPPGLEGSLQRRGIAGQQVRRGEGLGDDRRKEPRARSLPLVHRHVVDQVLDLGRCGEVALHQPPVHRHLGPGGIGEPPVTSARPHLRPPCCDRRQLPAEQPRVAGEQARTRRRHADASGGRQQLGRVEPHERVGSENGTQGLLRRLVAERRVRPAGLSHALSPVAAVQD